MEYREFLKSAANVVPSKRQLAWYDTQFYAFVHFTVNNFTDLEWGLGTEDENIFNPTELDCDQWVEAVKSAGMKGIILTAKHHDGFCLWQTETTAHSVKNSKWRDGKGDVVKECAEACKRGGIKFGVYISPWDRNCPLYGTSAYNDFYAAQLTELMSNYGEIFQVWFDGACGEGPTGRKQVYDFPRFVEIIRRLQPNACIWNDRGPDIRCCGNEAGVSRKAEWSVVPHELVYLAEKQTGPGPLADAGTLEFLESASECIGDLHTIQYSRGLAFCGQEIDMSIRPGWFYHEYEKPHSLERLMNTYINSCGANTSFNLNIPPMPTGKFHPDDVARLKELGEAIQATFGQEKRVAYERTDISMGETQCRIQLKLAEKVKLAYVELQENIANGQRVEHFRIMMPTLGVEGSIGFVAGMIYESRTIGNRRICQVLPVETDELEIQILAARDEIQIKNIIVYKQ